MPLYDTSIFVGHIRGTKETRQVVQKLWDGAWPVTISSVTRYELYFGCLITDDAARHIEVVENYLSHVSTTFPLDDAVAYRAAEIQAVLRRSNQMLDHRDLFIAATALQHDLSICTLDVDHFARVPNLAIEAL